LADLALRGTRMNTDHQSKMNSWVFAQQVNGFDPDFHPELFLYPWRSGESVVKMIG
jgi:hypothetical protein